MHKFVCTCVIYILVHSQYCRIKVNTRDIKNCVYDLVKEKIGIYTLILINNLKQGYLSEKIEFLAI